MARAPLAALLALLLAAPAAHPGDDKAPGDGRPKEKPGEAAKETPAERPKEAGKERPKPVAVEVKAPPIPRSRREALRFLERVTLSVDFDATPLADAVGYIAALADANIILGPALRSEGGVDALKVTLRLKKVTARQALEFVADGQGLGIGFVSGVLTVTTRKEARGKPVLRLHALGDLLMPLTDFPAPDLVLRPAGAEKKVEEETVHRAAFGDADEVIDLIRKTVAPPTWEEEGISISLLGEFLAVRQYEEVQDEIGRLLALLHAAR